jgi:hypothetical protein
VVDFPHLRRGILKHHGMGIGLHGRRGGPFLPAKRAKIGVDNDWAIGSVVSPCDGLRMAEVQWEGETALKCRARVGAGGHNNIKLNPVFRGMVCSATADGLSTKGKQSD